MTKVIYPVQGEWLHVKLIGTCIVVRNYIELHYETQELRAISFCGDDCRKWRFNSHNAILTFYAYCLNHIGMHGFKIRLKQRTSPSKSIDNAQCF